mmetsp:Transcript_68970/g.197827  ORF Transcript_68970/g.197827 Transcript_68970/m.197827 type:complete len:286 (+) Transcript_68970:11-868(+)
MRTNSSDDIGEELELHHVHTFVARYGNSIFLHAQAIRVGQEEVRARDTQGTQASTGRSAPELDDTVRTERRNRVVVSRVHSKYFCVMSAQAVPRLLLLEIVNVQRPAHCTKDTIRAPQLHQRNPRCIRHVVELDLLVGFEVHEVERRVTAYARPVDQQQVLSIEIARCDICGRAEIEQLELALDQFSPRYVDQRRGEGKEHAHPRSTLKHVLDDLGVFALQIAKPDVACLRVGPSALPAATRLCECGIAALVVQVQASRTLVRPPGEQVSPRRRRCTLHARLRHR